MSGAGFHDWLISHPKVGAKRRRGNGLSPDPLGSKESPYGPLPLFTDGRTAAQFVEEVQQEDYVVLHVLLFVAMGRDTVEAVVWPMSEAAAVLLDRSLRLSEHETALELGWLLAEAPAGTGAELLRDLEMVVAIMNRAQRRLAGAAATELDHQQRKAARHQIDRVKNQLRRIDETILPEKDPHVESSTTHHDSGTARAGSKQTRDCAGAGDLPSGSAPYTCSSNSASG